VTLNGGGGRTNTWDSENRMTQCAYNGTTSQFTYAAGGIRHRSVVNGVTTDFALDANANVRIGGSSGIYRRTRRRDRIISNWPSRGGLHRFDQFGY